MEGGIMNMCANQKHLTKLSCLCSAQPVIGVNTVALTMNTHTLPIHHFVISKWQLFHFGSKLFSQCLTQVYFPP